MAAMPPALSPEQVIARFDDVIRLPADALVAAAPELGEELLLLGESVLESWLVAHNRQPTEARVEGFRLLGLHRRAAKGDPSFNACRETCRELVYYRNLVQAGPGHPDVAQRLRLEAMVARHLALFVSSKLEVAGFGEFCCSSRPLHAQDASSAESD